MSPSDPIEEKLPALSLQGDSAPPPRILALDVGNRRIGMAITDPLGYTVQPLLTLIRKSPRADLKSIGRLVRRFSISEVVVGNPLHMSGEVSPQALKSQRFADEIRATFNLPVHLLDERLTTAEAHAHLDALGHPRESRKDVIDQLAAMLILESFLADRAHRSAIRERFS